MLVFRGPVTPVSQRDRKLRALGALRSATPQLRSISPRVDYSGTALT